MQERDDNGTTNPNSGPRPLRMPELTRSLTIATYSPRSINEGTEGDMYDRDWYYPSLVGSIRTRVRPPRVPPEAKKIGDNLVPFGKPCEQVTEKEKLEGKTERKGVVRETISQARKCGGQFDHSLIIVFLLVFSISSVSFAISQRKKLLNLKEQFENLHNCCISINTSNSSEISKTSKFSNKPESVNIFLYTIALSFLPIFFIHKLLDLLTRARQTSKNLNPNSASSEEGVPLKKRIAYRVDIFFSIHPYAKLLALLVATILLICFGGVALYTVNNGSGSFVEALWLSWTFVADSGHHADQVGLGPRIVSVSISSGGMLVFATMLGLVSDAISEKVDSWRKGKSEVIESNHILILGWSDKLTS